MPKIERINFDGELNIFERLGPQFFDYPVIHIPEYGSISINKEAADLLPEGTTKVFLASFMDYIAVLPDDYRTAGNNLFAYQNKNRMLAYPSSMKAKKIRPGYYKLYQYRNGFAFNRFECMGKDGNVIEST
jgi:hypothetical protein